MTKNQIKYYMAIIASLIDILAIIGGICGIIYFTVNPVPAGFITMDGNVTQADMAKIYQFICAAVVILGVMLLPVSTKTRQKLRDLAEYDSDGNSKKHNFSNMSAKERKVLEQQRVIEAEKILDTTTLKKITHEGVKNPQEELDNLIGLDSVKNKMAELVAKMQFEKRKWKDDGGKGKFISNEPMSMIFLGPPGTGKTTVARIMAGFLYQNGYIRKNQCVEVDGNFLKGAYVGESAKKTSMLIRKSMGGVLFIDEAYTLLTGSGGAEAIATLIKEMEDHRDDIVFIFAGYEKEMKQFIDSNPGIASRIKHYLYFGNYSIRNFQEIFLDLAHKDGYKVSNEYLEAFVHLMQKEQTQANFGNARTVRNIYEKTISRHALNIANHKLSEDKRYCICAYDIPENSKY